MVHSTCKITGACPQTPLTSRLATVMTEQKTSMTEHFGGWSDIIMSVHFTFLIILTDNVSVKSMPYCALSCKCSTYEMPIPSLHNDGLTTDKHFPTHLGGSDSISVSSFWLSSSSSRLFMSILRLRAKLWLS